MVLATSSVERRVFWGRTWIECFFFVLNFKLLIIFVLDKDLNGIIDKSELT